MTVWRQLRELNEKSDCKQDCFYLVRYIYRISKSHVNATAGIVDLNIWEEATTKWGLGSLWPPPTEASEPPSSLEQGLPA